MENSKYYLGKLCKKNHEYEYTGKSLRLKSNKQCVKCKKFWAGTKITNTDYILRKRFNITLSDYNEILEKQNGKCAICRKPETIKENGITRRLAVDHDHTTGKVRGLLCYNCNTGIGKLNDDVNILIKAIEYLK